MKDALDIHRALLERQIPHEIVRLPNAILTADEIPDSLGVPAATCLAVRMYETDGQLHAFVVRAGRTPRTGAVLAAAGVRVAHPAPADVVNRVTDYAAELVAPLLLPSRVRVFLDRSVIVALDSDEVVYTPTGDVGTALGIRVRDLVERSAATLVDLATRVLVVPDLPGAVHPRVRSAHPLAAGPPRG